MLRLRRAAAGILGTRSHHGTARSPPPSLAWSLGWPAAAARSHRVPGCRTRAPSAAARGAAAGPPPNRFRVKGVGCRV